ncbi:MAG: outer membrane protein assembly factor, partial [Muribaculaceae bacterium]|nr:outer membrane protein assembly factor [Muribaculaceae bacterium]
MRHYQGYTLSAFAWIVMLILASCSSTRHVPAGKYLLDEVKINLNDSTGRLQEQQLSSYVRMQPNHKMLWSAKFRLGIYNMSGKDTTKWINRWVRKLGEPPVIFNSEESASDAQQLLKAMENAGFLDAKVSVDTLPNARKRKMKVIYNLDAGAPHTIRSIDYKFPNDTLRRIIMEDSARFSIQTGDPLDLSLLEQQRESILNRLRNKGYYAFGKEFITFNADTTEGSKEVDLTMTIKPSLNSASRPLIDTHREYFVRNIYFIMDYNPGVTEDFVHYEAQDTVHYKDITILYGKNRYLRPGVLNENCFIRKKQPYNERSVNETYKALGRLSILKFINIRFVPVGNAGDIGFLDAYILLTPAKSQSFSAELEGTNSEGDLGVAAGLTYTHRNIANGSETLTTKVRGAYESLRGNLSGLIHDRYLELGAEAGINFPKFKAPLLKEAFKRRIKATTEFHLSMNYQERPEYTRIISTAGWSYKWSERINRNRHTFTPVDINYVYLPESTNDFLDEIAPDNPLLRYSYEDHFIMLMGYSFYHTNKRQTTPWNRSFQSDIYTVRVNTEIAGNFLFAISSLVNHRSNFHEQPY